MAEEEHAANIEVQKAASKRADMVVTLLQKERMLSIWAALFCCLFFPLVGCWLCYVGKDSLGGWAILGAIASTAGAFTVKQLRGRKK